jgi:hypothetical protein
MTLPLNSPLHSPLRSPLHSPLAWKWDDGAVDTGDAILDTLQVETDGLVIDGLLNRTLVRTATVDSASTPSALLTYTAPSVKYITNSAGELRYANHNLILQSQTLDNASWVNDNSTDTANQAVAPDGTTTMDLVYPTTTGVGQVYQEIVFVAGMTYTVSAYFKTAGLGHAYIQVNADAVVTNAAFVTANLSTGAIGTITNLVGNLDDSATATLSGGIVRINYTFVATASATGRVYLGPADAANSRTATTSGTNGVYIWGVQVKRSPVHDAGTLADYVPTTTAARYMIQTDHTAAGVPLGIPNEEARTNLSLRSEEFSNAYWDKTNNVTVTADNVVAPDGTTTADTLSEGTANNVHYIYPGVPGYSLTAAGYTFSAYLKYADLPNVRMLFVTGGFADGGYVDIDLSSGTIGAATNVGAGVATGATITAIGSGWYRVTLSITGTAVIYFPVIRPLSAALALSYLGTNRTIGLWGVQVELGSFATSYIKTTTGTVTRAIDNISLLTSAFPYSATVGSITTAFNVKGVGATIVAASLSDGTANERISSFAHTGSHLMMVDGGVTQDDIDAGTVAINTNTKISTAWQLNSTGAAINGAAAVAGDGTATIPTMTTLRLMNRYDGTVAATGHLRYLKYLPRRITNANLATEST